MQLSPGEKLILCALADLSDREKHPEIDLSFVRSAILDGHLWALDWRYGFLNPDNETSAEVADETAKILSMWRLLEQGFASLDAAEKGRVMNAIAPYDVEFDGFDGNQDPHHSAAVFLVEDLDRFTELKGRSLNSHSSTSLPRYRKMLVRYKALDLTAVGRSSVLPTADEIIAVLKPPA